MCLLRRLFTFVEDYSTFRSPKLTYQEVRQYFNDAARLSRRAVERRDRAGSPFSLTRKHFGIITGKHGLKLDWLSHDMSTAFAGTVNCNA